MPILGLICLSVLCSMCQKNADQNNEFQVSQNNEIQVSQNNENQIVLEARNLKITESTDTIKKLTNGAHSLSFKPTVIVISADWKD